MSGQVYVSQKFLPSYCAHTNLNEMHFNLTFPIATFALFHFVLFVFKEKIFTVSIFNIRDKNALKH